MKVILLIPFIMLASVIVAQQIPQYSQYMFNHFAINPALAGSKDCIDARLGYRKQWVGFDGAPTTAWVSIHGAFTNKSKPYQKSKHGFGAFLETDETGPLAFTMFNVAYSYHIKLNEKWMTSFGVFIGVQQHKLDAGQVTLTNFNDPAIDNGGSAFVVPEIWPGVLVYNDNTFYGFSIRQALGNSIGEIGLESKLSRHLLLNGGHRFRSRGKLAYIPSTLIKVTGGAPMAIDFNLMMEYEKVFAIGVSYRNVDAIVAMFRISFLKFFTLGYAYDMTTSKIKVGSSNTHEIILGINACPHDNSRNKIVRCPAFE